MRAKSKKPGLKYREATLYREIFTVFKLHVGSEKEAIQITYKSQ